MWHPMWEPLWQAVNEVNLPLHFHTFPTRAARACARRRPGVASGPRCSPSVSGFQMNLVNILAAIIGAAVLERYPNLEISFGESGIGWIPYALDRMDFEWEDRFRDLGLTMKPSDYWRRQCKATFQFDRIGTKLIDEMGVETLMWGSDYPHTDGVWPESSKYIEEQFGHLPADVVRKITCENAGEVLRPDEVTMSGPSPATRHCGSSTGLPASVRWPRSSRLDEQCGSSSPTRPSS